MKHLSQDRAQRGQASRQTRGSFVAGAAGLVLALAACAQHGLENVKPTATTAYHTPLPEAPQPAPPR
jgi:hypothetical protein